MTTDSFLEEQQTVVRAVLADVSDADWVRIAADVEIIENSEAYHFDIVALAVVRCSDGTLEDPSISIGHTARKAIAALYRARKKAGSENFGSFELRIDRDGNYRFDFSYDPPKRLNGIWDAEKERRFDNYLEHYQRELADRN